MLIQMLLTLIRFYHQTIKSVFCVFKKRRRKKVFAVFVFNKFLPSGAQTLHECNINGQLMHLNCMPSHKL